MPIVRAGWLGSALLLGSCSFVDDFDKFGPRDEDVTSEDGRVQHGDAGGERAHDADATGDAAMVDGAPRDGAGFDGSREAGPGPDEERDAGAAGDDASGEPDPACGVCDDGDPCTDDRCVEGGCTFTLLDADGDGFAKATCAAGSPHRGDDCDDALAAVHPSAPELCDGIDNDCSDGVDEGFRAVACYPDRDGDGYPDLGSAPAMRCVCGAAERQVVEPVDEAFRAAQHDCWDGTEERAKLVHPGQTEYFEEPYRKPGAPPSYDYDCRAGEEPKFTSTVPAGGCQGLLDLVCGGAAGFVGELPACGTSATYTTCSAGVLSVGCGGTAEVRRQPCR